jgi:hypothetical protein
MIIREPLGCSFARIDLRAHLLQTRSKRFNLLLLLCDGRFLLLVLAMLLEKLIEQHRVHRFIAHTLRLALIVASHQSGVYLFHFLSHETELRDALGVKLMLVAKGHRFQRKNRFARLVHRFDPVLETLGGNDRAELTVSIDYYPDLPLRR